jgi:mannose-6-phosphate isomerase-like protein (cupin superfamily)
LFTGSHSQLVMMCLQPGDEIGNKVHADVDPFFRIEQGEAKFIFNGTEEHLVGDGEAVIVPVGTFHNVPNPSKTIAQKLYTVYSEPNHPDGPIHKDKEEAEEAERVEHHQE